MLLENRFLVGRTQLHQFGHVDLVEGGERGRSILRLLETLGNAEAHPAHFHLYPHTSFREERERERIQCADVPARVSLRLPTGEFGVGAGVGVDGAFFGGGAGFSDCFGASCLGSGFVSSLGTGADFSSSSGSSCFGDEEPTGSGFDAATRKYQTRLSSLKIKSEARLLRLLPLQS